MRALIPALALAVLATACASTVQVTSSGLQGGGSDALGAATQEQVGNPATADGQGSAPAATGTSRGAATGSGAVAPNSSGARTAPTGTTTVPGASAPSQSGSTPKQAVEIGLFVGKDLGPATKALGVDGLATGNGVKQATTAVELLNSRGGLAGHQVKPVIFEFDVQGDANSQYQSACSLFFDDHKVKALVSILLIPSLEACAAKHGAPYVTEGNRTTSTKELGRYPLLVAGAQMSLERAVPLQVQSLKAQGWLTATSKTGLLYNEDNDFAVVPGLVSSALRSAGLPPLVDTQSMPGVDDTSRVSAAASAGQNASLRFASHGIDRVLVVDKSGQAIAYFAIAAQNQNYYPAFGISSLELPNILRTVLSAKQLANARGIGWSPGVDLKVAQQPVLSSNFTACINAMKKAGEDMSSAATRFGALSTCDGVLLLAAAWPEPALTTSGFLSGLRSLGKKYPTVLTFGADFSNRRDGASQYRPLAFSSGCDCFTYTGPTATA